MSNRSADTRAKLLQSVLRFGKAVGFIDSVVGASRRVPVVIEPTAMEHVAARAGHCINEARPTPIDCRVRTDRNLKLLDRIFTVQIWNAITALDVGEIVAGRVASVDGKGIGAISIGVPRILATLLPSGAYQPGVAVRDSIWREQGKVGVAPSVERQFFDERSLQDRAGGGFGRPQQRRNPGHLDRVP